MQLTIRILPSTMRAFLQEPIFFFLVLMNFPKKLVLKTLDSIVGGLLIFYLVSKGKS